MMMTVMMMVVMVESSYDLSLSQICVPHIMAQCLFIYLLFIHLWLIS